MQKELVSSKVINPPLQRDDYDFGKVGESKYWSHNLKEIVGDTVDLYNKIESMISKTF